MIRRLLSGNGQLIVNVFRYIETCSINIYQIRQKKKKEGKPALIYDYTSLSVYLFVAVIVTDTLHTGYNYNKTTTTQKEYLSILVSELKPMIARILIFSFGRWEICEYNDV